MDTRQRWRLRRWGPAWGCLIATLAAAAGCTGDASIWVHRSASPTPSHSIASGRPASYPAGVRSRDDCPQVPAMIEPDCRPRVPTALPTGGGQRAAGGDPAAAAQVLCSGVPDDTVSRILGGAFLAYTNARGECHLNRTGLTEPAHDIALTSALSPKPATSFRPADDPSWHRLPAGPLLAGYDQVGDSARYYQVALGPDPAMPGTLLVSCRYVVFADRDSTATIPAPPQFWAGADAYVQQLAAYLTP